ncbi:nuclear transport factor 2 family protein [Thermobifida alba]|uniref:Nuclear transport factor 2 family protein n=1 Tax=Thermobifida alba TaxID=53522 RepID=A0ABY4KY77_THEAE|nr:nuclear transport factor 2 family protein [Thermobifida alba]UPT20371.1 nuclear transport factor 2 family protein [Thermobifida alba]HLU96694.1 nuclear transport factor 2 family protein [Thermobifida alba]
MTATDPHAVEDLLNRVRRLEEMETARNHLHRYAETLDDPTPEAVAALFTEDGVLRTRRGDAVGRRGIAEFYRRLLQLDPAEKRHFITSPKTTWLAPGLVEVSSYFLFTGRGADRSAIGWGTYLDRIRVTGDEALIAEKTITMHVGTDLDAGWPA